MAKTSVAEKLKNVDMSGDAMTAADNVLETLGMKPKASATQKTQARKARKGASLAGKKRKVTTPKTTTQAPPAAPSITTASAGELAGIGGVSFQASDYITGDIWVPNANIPSIDEATYEAQKTQAEGQSRAIEVAAINLKTSTVCISSKAKQLILLLRLNRIRPSMPSSKALKSITKLNYSSMGKSQRSYRRQQTPISLPYASLAIAAS